MRIIPSCNGVELHGAGEPGHTLVGWYPSKTKAHAALRQTLAEPVAHLNRLYHIIAFIEAARLVGMP